MLRWIKSTFGVIGASLLLGGCAKTPGSKPPEMLRSLARSYMIGTTYDQALIAAQQGDKRALRGRLNKLDELNATDISSDLQLVHAEDLVRSAESLDIKAQRIKRENPALSQQMQGEATKKYRYALHWSPQFPSENPLLLNALGYYLADRGASTEDFELAARLTNRAVAILQKTINDNEKADGDNQRSLNQMRHQQALTRDSYAWALYKLKRYAQAEAAQLAALAEIKNSGMKDREALAELQSHLTKIRSEM